jgi:hypothetical protein
MEGECGAGAQHESVRARGARVARAGGGVVNGRAEGITLDNLQDCGQ